MNPITTVRAKLPCPACGAVGTRIVAVRAPTPSTEVVELSSRGGLPAGSHVGSVSECEGCWSRRADRIAAARRRLTTDGRLTTLGPAREDAWLGVPLSRCEEQFGTAFASALLKGARGEALPPESGRVTIELLRDEEKTQAEPELIAR